MVAINKLVPCLTQHGENGYASINVCGRELYVFVDSVEGSDATNMHERWMLPADITCVDGESADFPTGFDKPAAYFLRVVLGLADGAVLCQEVGIADALGTKTWSECGRMQGAVTIVHLGPGFVLASSDAETALFFPIEIACSSHQPEWIKVAVDLVSAQLQESFIFSAEISDTFTTWHSCPTCVMVVHANKANGGRKEDTVMSDQCTLLLGCADGTVWWVTSPMHSAVLQLHASYGTLGAEAEPITLQAQLWETFPRYVARLLLLHCNSTIAEGTSASLASKVEDQEQAQHGVTCNRLLTVVEEGGRCTVLSVPVDGDRGTLRWEQRRVHAAYQLPASAALTEIQELQGVLLWACEDTGALVSCYCSESGGSGDEEARAVCLPITSTRSPYIDAFAVVMLRGSDAKVGGTAATGSVLLSTPAGVLVCPFLLPAAVNDEARHAQQVVEVLRAACGENGSRQPFALIHTGDAEQGTLSTEQGTLSTEQEIGDPSTAVLRHSPGAAPTQKYTSVVQSLGEQLTATHRQLAALQVEGQALDCELLKVTALLDVLGGDRTGLQLHALSSTQAPPAAGLIAPKSLFDWSPVHTNHTRSVSCRYRFRMEPAGTTGTTFHGNHSSVASTATHLDLQITAHYLVAMRALQGHILLCSLQSTSPATSLHCSVSTWSAEIALRADAGGATYTFLHTFPVDSLAQLCSYRLLLGIIVDGPDCGVGRENARSRDSANDLLLTLLDVLLPLSDLLPVVTSSEAYRSAQQLSALQKRQNRLSHVQQPSQYHSSLDAQSGARASTASQSLTLPTNPSSDQNERTLAGFTIARDAALVRWQHSAALSEREQKSHISRELFANSNPLQAAFLRSSTASSLSVKQDASAGHLLLQVTTVKEAGSQAAHSAHRSLLAAVSADLHSALLAQVPPPPTAAAVYQPSTDSSTAVGEFDDATDSAWLPTAMQQALVAATHLARQCTSGSFEGPGLGTEEGALLYPAAVQEADGAAEEEVWRLYWIARHA